MIFHFFTRHLKSLRGDLYGLLSLLLIYPIALYILIVLPLSSGIIDGVQFYSNNVYIKETNYESFSVIGIWIVCSCSVSVYLSSIIIQRLAYIDNQFEIFSSTPIYFYDIISSVVLSSFLFGVIELIISIMFTYFIDIVNPLLVFEGILIMINILLLVLLSSIIGIVIGLLFNSYLGMLLSNIALLLFLIFLSGTFIPKSLLVDSMQRAIIFLPYSGHIESIERLYLENSLNYLPIFGTIVLSIVLYIFTIVYIGYSLRK